MNNQMNSIQIHQLPILTIQIRFRPYMKTLFLLHTLEQHNHWYWYWYVSMCAHNSFKFTENENHKRNFYILMDTCVCRVDDDDYV